MAPPLSPPPAGDGEAAGKSDRDLLLELMDKMTNALSTLNSPPEVNEATVRANKLEKLWIFHKTYKFKAV